MGHARSGAVRFALRAVALCVVSPAIAGASGAAEPDGLAPAESRGRQIYVTGESPAGGEVVALMGEAGTEVPATVLPCVNCHGENGRGVPEGGVVPTNITWEALTKPYGVRHANGRRHPPYDLPRLKRAIAMGIDPAGNELHLAMPRYRLSHGDMEDLVAYLGVLGSDLDPGLSRERIRIGTLLPRQGPFAARGAAMEAVLRAYFDELNEVGGIYNRTIELQVGATGAGPQMTADAARRFIDETEPFALTGVFLAGAESEIAHVAAEEGVPLVGGLAVNPHQDALVNRHVFYLDAGLEGQAQALIEFDAGQRKEERRPLAILHREGAPVDAVIDAIDEQARARGWTAIEKIPLVAAGFDPAALVRRMQERHTETLFLLASGAPERAILAEAGRVDWRPTVLLPGSLASSEVFDFPASVGTRLFLAFAALPSDRTPGGLDEYRRLAEKHHLTGEFPVAQFAALSSAKILVEGLKRAGSELSREALLVALNDLRDFDTQFTPQVTYGPNRRVGVNGAHIVGLDLDQGTFVPISGWIELN